MTSFHEGSKGREGHEESHVQGILRDLRVPSLLRDEPSKMEKARHRALVSFAVMLLIPLLLACVSQAQQAGALPHVVVQTELGNIEIEVDTARAPLTSANFLKYVDARHFHGGTWHRTVKMDNQPDNQIKIEVIQAGVNPDRTKEGFAPIPLERTSKTGILHKDGTVSMARGGADSATSGFFICINDQPSLDFGGMRNADGQGFAAFGHVVRGMDVVRRIQQAPNTDAQKLTPPVKIVAVTRR
jgi:peptidyl-prolyl cis-trans isomerase A (cyclophilin A)